MVLHQSSVRIESCIERGTAMAYLITQLPTRPGAVVLEAASLVRSAVVGFVGLWVGCGKLQAPTCAYLHGPLLRSHLARQRRLWASHHRVSG